MPPQFRVVAGLVPATATFYAQSHNTEVAGTRPATTPQSCRVLRLDWLSAKGATT